MIPLAVRWLSRLSKSGQTWTEDSTMHQCEQEQESNEEHFRCQNAPVGVPWFEQCAPDDASVFTRKPARHDKEYETHPGEWRKAPPERGGECCLLGTIELTAQDGSNDEDEKKLPTKPERHRHKMDPSYGCPQPLSHRLTPSRAPLRMRVAKRHEL